MNPFQARLHRIFQTLDRRIDALNEERAETGGLKIPRGEIRLLGQMSLLANEEVSARIHLAETGDMDALLRADYLFLRELKPLLRENGFIYDESSEEIWIPEGAHFEELFDFENVRVVRIDAESALVSKAIKAPEKNRILVREAIASGEFPALVDRIEAQGGNLETFLEEA
jgi:hypothetical protein